MFLRKPSFLSPGTAWEQYAVSNGLAEIFVEDIPDETVLHPELNLPPVANAALKQAHSLDVLDKRLKSSLHRVMVEEEQLARDLAIFGDTHRDEILAAYDISPIQLVELLESERFAQRIQAIRTQINQDSKGLIRARAEMYLQAGLDSAFEIANSSASKDGDRLKAIQFLAMMADAVPKNTTVDGMPSGNSGGVNVVFNFGEQHPKHNELKGIVIEHGA